MTASQARTPVTRSVLVRLPLLLLTLAGWFSSPAAVHAQASARAAATLEERLQRSLDSLRAANVFPGVTLGVALADGRSFALASGMSDTTRKVPMAPGDRLLQGSVGKTYVAAVALQLAQEGRLSLDDPISRFFSREPWFPRLRGAARITVRQLLNHTSGLVRYEFDPRATALLRREPYKVWSPEDRLAMLFDATPPFAAGAGWEYSDTNFIVLGMIIERITGRSYHDELRDRILRPLALRNTIPSDRPRLEGVVNGYAGPENELGGYDASLAAGQLAVNPQFEWTGGGIASTADDLARWMRELFAEKVLQPRWLEQMVDGVPSRLGPGVRYGLGMMIRETPAGRAYGHSGFFPGYATEVLYFPERGVAVAVQVNVTDPYPRGLVRFLASVAAALPRR